jgi:lipopolysaccharide transport system permease protein
MTTHTLNTDWTKTIKPKVNALDFKLAEIWSYRDLLFLFVKRDYVSLYKQTVLGPAWYFIQSALGTLVSFLLFNVIARISTNGINPILFQMSGIIIWNYFASSLLACSTVFIKNANVFGKVYFPRLIMPLSIIFSNIIQFIIQFTLILASIIYFALKDHTGYFGFAWLMIPVYLLLMAGIGLGLGILISSLTTKYRDLTVLLNFGIQLLMYASAVNYPLSSLAQKNKGLYSVLKWNPLSGVIDGFRNCLLLGKINLESLLFPFIFMIITLLGGILLFNKVERDFMDTV